MAPRTRSGGKRAAYGNDDQASSSRANAKGEDITDPILLDDEDDWVVRSEELEFFDPYVEYEGKQDYFTIGMHYGGVFHDEEYIGGQVKFIDSCNVRRFTLVEISSIMVALGCGLQYICEFFYALPENSPKCIGREVGHPLRPLVDDAHFEGFIALLPGALKEVHIYFVELTRTKAFVKARVDQQRMFEEFYKVKSNRVVIEEIDEPDIPRPKPKPKSRQILKRKASQLLLGWYEDPKFEEYMETSMENQHKIWRRASEELASVTENLGSKFDGATDCVNLHGEENEEMHDIHGVPVEPDVEVTGVHGQADPSMELEVEVDGVHSEGEPLVIQGVEVDDANPYEVVDYSEHE